MQGPTGGGERIARELFGDERYDRTRTNAADGPRSRLLQLADQVVFGNVYEDPTLALQERSMCTVAILAAAGHQQQLRAHIGGALHVGLTPAQIEAVITQVAMYAGFPAALNAMAVAEEVFAAHEDKP